MMSMVTWKYRIPAVAWRSLVITGLLLLVAGCGASKSVETKAPDYVARSARTLAIAPTDELVNDLFGNNSNQLAEAIGGELIRRGYSVIDANGATSLLAKNGVSRAPVLNPQALAALAKDGVDAVVSVSAEASVIGGPPMRHVKTKVTSTRTQREIGTVEWHNAWGGMPGSPADYMSRKGMPAAAKEIADALAKLLG